MRRAIVICLALLWCTVTALAQSRPQPVPPRPAAQRAVEQLVEDLYIAKFSDQVKLSDEQRPVVFPLLRQYMRNRVAVAQRRARILQTLDGMLQRNAAEADIRPLNDQFAQADRNAQNLERTFMNRIAPQLSSTQLAQVRLFQANFEQLMRQLLDQARMAVETQRQQRQSRNPAAVDSAP